MAGLWLFHVTGRRYLGVFLDPVQACNLRCRMCYFSGEEIKRNHLPPLDVNDLAQMADALFHRAVKVQIGCGAEPTLYPELVRVVKICKGKGVPYVSLTTNGKLLTSDLLERLVKEGLDELTLSAHGLMRDTYESLMVRSSYDDFLRVLRDVTLLKQRYPLFKLRVNYTVNEDNWQDLKCFGKVFAEVPLDIVQVRPIQDIGDSEYRNFSLDAIVEHYDEVFLPLSAYCKEHGIVCLYPLVDHLKTLSEEAPNEALSVQEFTYCYVYPGCCWREDFRFREEDFEKYCRRKKVGRRIWHSIWTVGGHSSRKEETTRALNYKIR